ncbi:hypothetical protein SynA1562_01775 [Synechococcus sp. A15-62]|nr:hypothetical protein SynA1562_01775 [Synechococcus sp. A15-62]
MGLFSKQPDMILNILVCTIETSHSNQWHWKSWYNVPGKSLS